MDTPPISWPALDQFALLVLGAGAELAWKVESPFGCSTSYKVNDDFCVGRVEFLEFESGLKAIIFDCQWAQQKMHMIPNDGWLRFNFSLDTALDLQVGEAESLSASQPSWRIVSMPPGKAITGTVPAGKRAHWITVCSTPKIIEAVTGLATSDLPQPLSQLSMHDNEKAFHESGSLSARINSIARDVMANKMTGPLRVPYIESRCVELLCLSLEQLSHPPEEPDQIRLTKGDLERVAKVHECLVAEFSDAPTISELGKRFGLNKNKLIAGFKKQYGKTISDFVQEQRLEEARRLLQQTDLPIIDVANQVGFNHQSNFATAMRRRFGMTPKQFRA